MSVHTSLLAEDSLQLPEPTTLVSPFNSLASRSRRAGKVSKRLCNSLPFYSAKHALRQAAATAAGKLLRTSDSKFDFESPEGHSAAAEYLGVLESLCSVLAVATSSRRYRADFAQAYQVLYADSDLGYLPEIIDAAQEQLPHLWVNGEEYPFTNKVLDRGAVLYQRFVELLSAWNEELSTQQLRMKLEQLDDAWTRYERVYILELMTIEANARGLVQTAIRLDYELTNLSPGTEYNLKRRDLVEVLGKLNSAANDQGHGRDDLSFHVLLAAEDILKRKGGSQALRQLCLRVTDSFTALRLLFRKYASNLEEVDPQLKNNDELVEALVAFESSWEKGQAFIVNSSRLRQLLQFSKHIEELGQKHAIFAEQLKDRDSQIFFVLPALLLLLKLEHADEDAAAYYCLHLEDENTAEGLEFSKLERLYQFGSLVSCSSKDYAHLLESAVLGLEYDRTRVLPSKYDNLDETLKVLKGLAIQVTRHVPTEWNLFVEAALAES